MAAGRLSTLRFSVQMCHENIFIDVLRVLTGNQTVTRTFSHAKVTDKVIISIVYQEKVQSAVHQPVN